MATPTNERIVQNVKQTFSYCDLCRHSHDRGRKHAFSQRHRDKVKAVLGKYGAKVKLAKLDMKEPCILTGCFESDSKYWCYMCACEVSKHVGDGEVTVRHAAFIEHLMSTGHAQKVDRFWRVNRIETALQSKFIFSEGAQGAYKKAVEEALTRHEEKEDRLLSQSAAKIRRLESNRSQLSRPSDASTSVLEPSETLVTASPGVTSNEDSDWTVGSTVPPGIGRAGAAGGRVGNRWRAGRIDNAQSCSSWSDHQVAEAHEQGVSCPAERRPNVNHPAASGHNQRGPVGSGVGLFQAMGKFTVAGQPPPKPGVLSRVKTVGVISSGGLTAVSVKPRGFAGNIHTGAPPPWLRDDNDEEETEGQLMGPSEMEFKKHLEQQRKSKLNPGRVGANFDHTSPASEEWLPSFGRVWNSGRRLQSRQQYKKEVDKSKRWKAHHPASSTTSKPP